MIQTYGYQRTEIFSIQLPGYHTKQYGVLPLNLKIHLIIEIQKDEGFNLNILHPFMKNIVKVDGTHI